MELPRNRRKKPTYIHTFFGSPSAAALAALRVALFGPISHPKCRGHVVELVLNSVQAGEAGRVRRHQGVEAAVTRLRRLRRLRKKKLTFQTNETNHDSFWSFP